MYDDDIYSDADGFIVEDDISPISNKTKNKKR